ncbi:MAG: flagellar biosynthesis protein FlhB [Deltaproteobacteria bacterium]|nr:flagellar biosynthesis protein FlhB [Deltaproteobacteria bacterium]
MAETYQEKTERPTEKRLEEARKKGQVAISREIPASLIIIFLSVFLYFSMSHAFSHTFKFYAAMVQSAQLEFDIEAAKRIGKDTFFFWMKMVLPVFCLLFFISVMSYVIQVGFIFTSERLKFNLQNLNPIEGIRRMFSKRAAVEVLKSLVKVAILATVVYWAIKGELAQILSLTGRDLGQIVKYIGDETFGLTLKLGLIFLFIAGLDYMYQRWQYMKDLMMTRQELKEEYKEREGNPLVKARIRAMQRAFATRRMMEEVRRADVVITNPTHYAVALKYEMGKMPAPRVAGKGAGYLAEKIKEVALINMIPVVENKILAQALYFSVEVGDYIPEKFYVVVAEILAKVYRMKGRIIN